MSTLLLLSFGSGCAALIYELVWFQRLELVIGASSLSLAALLASFMGGMALGSALVPVAISSRRHPLRVYAWLELGIAASALLLPIVLPFVEGAYLAAVGQGYAALLTRTAAATACLLLPTTLMGATLPVLARWLATRTQDATRLGLVYAANTAGGVTGTLAASFFLLRVYDMSVATYIAVALNVLVAAGALWLARTAPDPDRDTAQDVTPDAGAARPWRQAPILIGAGLSGLTALGAQVIWTRQLSLLIGATVYSFSLILATFLAGIGLGGWIGASWARRSRDPRLAFAWTQALLVVAIAYGSRAIVDLLPLLQPTTHQFASVYASNGLGFFWDAARCMLAMLPATTLWGTSFALALAAAAPGHADAGRPAAAVNASNTIGSLLGAILFTLLAIPHLGSQRSQQLLALIAAAAACAACWPTARDDEPRSRRQTLTLLGSLVPAAMLALWLVPAVPSHLIAYGRNVGSWSTIERFLHVAEGVTASVAVTEVSGGAKQFHIAGKVEASNLDIDMRLERMLGHIPALVHPNPKSVLVVGFGAGITAGSFLVHPGIERIVICEIEPAVPPASGHHFASENYHLLDDRRVQIVYDDARHFMETSKETFDIITSDPIHPWVRGAATLYSTEYLELVKAHLNPGGVVTQWIPLYETNSASVKSEIATFARAFPDTTLWNSDPLEDGYDLVALGRMTPAPIDVDAMQARLDRTPSVMQSLQMVTLNSAAWLMGTYAGRAKDLRPWLQDAEINHERNLRLQYLAGLAVRKDERATIFGEIWGYRAYPADLFVTSPGVEETLRQGY